LHKNTKHVHVLGLEGHVHDTNTSPKTNCATTTRPWSFVSRLRWNSWMMMMIEENIYKSTSRVEQSNNNYIS